MFVKTNLFLSKTPLNAVEYDYEAELVKKQGSFQGVINIDMHRRKIIKRFVELYNCRIITNALLFISLFPIFP